MHIRSLSNPKFKQFINNKNNFFFLVKVLIFQNIFFPLKCFIFLKKYFNLFALVLRVYWKKNITLIFYAWIIFKVEIIYSYFPVNYFRNFYINFLTSVILKSLFLRTTIPQNLIRFNYKFYPSFFFDKPSRFISQHFFLSTKFSMYKKIFFNENFLEYHSFEQKYNLHSSFMILLKELCKLYFCSKEWYSKKFNSKKEKNLDFKRFKQFQTQVFILKILMLIKIYFVIIYKFIIWPFSFFGICFSIIYLSTILSMITSLSFLAYCEYLYFFDYLFREIVEGISSFFKCCIVFVDFNLFLLHEILSLIQIIYFFLFNFLFK